MVAIATARYCSGVKGFPEHISVVVFVSCRVDSLMFARSSVFPRRNFAVSSGYVGDTSLFLGADVSGN